jgi:hypothetical protein
MKSSCLLLTAAFLAIAVPSWSFQKPSSSRSNPPAASSSVGQQVAPVNPEAMVRVAPQPDAEASNDASKLRIGPKPGGYVMENNESLSV